MWRNRDGLPAQLPGARRRAVRDGRGAAVRSSSGSTAGRRSAGASSSTRPGPAATTRYLVRRGRAVGRRALPDARRARRTAGSPASRAAATARWSTPMLRPDLFGGLATHAGDALFEMCYLPDFREVGARRCATSYDGSFDSSGRTSARGRRFAKDSDASLLNDWCMAACYSADADGTVRLPYDTETGRARAGGLGALARLGPGADGGRARRRAALAARDLHRRGKRDEYFLDLGAEAFRRALEAVGVTDVLLRALRRDAHRRSSTATRWR